MKVQILRVQTGLSVKMETDFLNENFVLLTMG